MVFGSECVHVRVQYVQTHSISNKQSDSQKRGQSWSEPELDWSYIKAQLHMNTRNAFEELLNNSSIQLN